MRKNYLIFLCFINLTFAQVNKESLLLKKYGISHIDSSAIMFKAKLFTVSEFGISKKEIILKDIENQEGKFLKTKYNKFMFMKIIGTQPYRTIDGGKTSMYGCEYILAFNKLTNTFYRIGGFDFLDLNSFFRDLKFYEYLNYLDKDDIKGNEIEGVDIICLFNLYEKKKRRKKKHIKCTNCPDRNINIISK